MVWAGQGSVGFTPGQVGDCTHAVGPFASVCVIRQLSLPVHEPCVAEADERADEVPDVEGELHALAGEEAEQLRGRKGEVGAAEVGGKQVASPRVAQLRWGARRAHPHVLAETRRPRLGNAEHEGNLDAAGEGELWEGGERERDAEQLAHQVRGREQARSEEWQQISLLPDRRQGLRRCRVRVCRSRCFSPIALHLDRDQTSLSSKPNGSKAKRDCAVWLAPSVIYVCSFP